MLAILIVLVITVAVAILLLFSTMIGLSPLDILASVFTKSSGTLYPPFSSKVLAARTRHEGKEVVLNLPLARKWAVFCHSPDIEKHISAVYVSLPLTMSALIRHVVASPDFPLSVMGVVHAKHVIEQFECIDASVLGVYNYSISVTGSRLNEIGAECDVLIEVSSPLNSRLLVSTTMTFTSTDAKKARAARKRRPELTAAEQAAKTNLGPTASAPKQFVEEIKRDHSKKYAACSGDMNPIHLPIYCKAMGLPKPIMHGVFSLARGVAAITDAYSLATVPKLRIAAAWKLPMPVPATAHFTFGELVDVTKTEHANGLDTTKFKRHIEFLATREGKGGTLPHLRGVVSF